VIDVFDENFHFLADLDEVGLIELAALEQRLRLAAKLDEELVAALTGNATGDDAAGLQVDEVFATDELLDVQHVAQLGNGGIGLGVEVTQGVEQVVINHKELNQKRRTTTALHRTASSQTRHRSPDRTRDPPTSMQATHGKWGIGYYKPGPRRCQPRRPKKPRPA
jgi:hypothetical protein